MPYSGDISYLKEKSTSYAPYDFKSELFWIFKTNILMYEGHKLTIKLSPCDLQAQRFVDLLNVAFQEGYEYRAMTHRCDENWRGEKLLVFGS